jgi:hypothetical protein
MEAVTWGLIDVNAPTEAEILYWKPAPRLLQSPEQQRKLEK